MLSKTMTFNKLTTIRSKTINFIDCAYKNQYKKYIQLDKDVHVIGL